MFLETISKRDFGSIYRERTGIAAKPDFPKKRDSPSFCVLFVGHKLQAYIGISMIENEAPPKSLSQ
jgi:hypothetical protein